MPPKAAPKAAAGASDSKKDAPKAEVFSIADLGVSLHQSSILQQHIANSTHQKKKEKI